jgi:hypothetical protein
VVEALFWVKTAEDFMIKGFDREFCGEFKIFDSFPAKSTNFWRFFGETNGET